ncbi:protein kinase [Pendulispora rubella]|uniref:Protein kinase n=1 Tax=Pendulispora rubella TaxID=2741070 RepID=A0ABZ2L0B2_9BACT
MLTPPIPDDEAKRLALLKACKIIYTPAEEAFDDIARLAAEICGTEIALITLVDADYQWFKARVGVEEVGTPRDLSFCGHCINHHHPLVVPDTHADPRFADNPLVTGAPYLRSYAGVPLLVEAGSSVGALSVADRKPMVLSEKQISSLELLARQISRELRLRRDLERAGANVSGEDFPVAPGAIVGGRWQVTRMLGKGGTGAVFEARATDGERVAVKVLLPEWKASEQVVERFAREARVLMRLRTRHVGKLFEVGNLGAREGGLPFLVLELLEGSDLENLLRVSGRIPVHDAFSWCADACEGVAEAHELGVVHRDLKPSNVFLASGGDESVIKVIDFGIAAGDPGIGSRSNLTANESLMGSPAYMAPEQMMASADVDARTDVWSMGVTLYELITGSLPFHGNTELELFANAMTKEPIPLGAHLQAPPQTVEAVLQRCLRRTRDDRFESMSALASALRAAIP